MTLFPNNPFPHHTCLRKWGFSINEGGLPVNLTIRWSGPYGFYVYAWGHSLHWFWSAK